MSAAFDAGSAIGIIFVFLAFIMNPNYQIIMPAWFGFSGDGDRCAPDFYSQCIMNYEQGQAFGQKYNMSLDTFCSGIGFMSDSRTLTPPSSA
jgi:hypothetical protein